ncbi:MAG: alpha/beta hydrolase fold domain-containing protein [Candidatus Cloacimonas sp.]|jgi:hypothetical protein|nr:alpha/beta hydrolase fold domain-containing protein [Candidatus Cloacimonas sp.]
MKNFILSVTLILVSCLVPLFITAGTITGEKESSLQPDRTTYSNLVYATISNKQKLDLYIPASGISPYPVIVWIHGGAFLMGDKADASEVTMINKLTSRGFAVASINYRFSSEAIYPAQIHDCKAAVRFLRANAATYSLDTSRFASWGASAGGCLASLLGTTYGIEELEGSDLGNSQFSSAVQVCVDWFGPIEFLTMDAQAAAQGFTINTNAATSPESKLIGAPIQTVPVQTNKANAMQYAGPGDAAFYGQHGTIDTNIPMLQTENLRNVLAAVLGAENAIYQVVQGAGHGGSAFQTDANVDAITAFIYTHLSAVEVCDETVPLIQKATCYPNPFSANTRISLKLSKSDEVKISIYNIKGQKVCCLFDGCLSAGMHNLQWNGADDSGKKLANGLYFATITGKRDKQTVKLAVLK